MRILVAFLFLLPLSSFAQYEDDYVPARRRSHATLPADSTTGRVSISQVVPVPGVEAADLFARAIRFAKEDRSKFFMSNGQKNVMLNKSNDRIGVQLVTSTLGFYDADQADGIVRARCGWRYEGSALGCPRLFIVEGDVLLAVKDNRTKITITNIYFRHFNISTGRQEAVYGQDKGSCRSSGTIEELLECEHCPNGLSRFYRFLQQSSRDLIAKYASGITRTPAGDGDW